MKITEYFREVKVEVAKISWPAKREVGVSLLLVGGVVGASSLFLLLVDAVLYRVVGFILG